MQKPNIEIKNYKTHGGREGIGFNLDLHINGIKCYHVRNDANGGCYSYYSYAPNNPKAEEIKTNIKLLDEYVATLEEKFEPLDSFIDSEINLIEKSKFEKKIQRMCSNHVIYGVPNSGRYKTIKYGKPLVELPKGQLLIALQRIKQDNFNEGYEFINDFTLIGISEFALKQMQLV